MNAPGRTGPQLVQVLSTLANPHRLRVVATLAAGRSYVSELARELGISRALLQVHLRKLEAAGLVTAQLELSEDGKAMKFYENTPFSLHLTPAEIARIASSLSPETGPTGKGPPTTAESDVETTERDNDNGNKGAPS